MRLASSLTFQLRNVGRVVHMRPVTWMGRGHHEAMLDGGGCLLGRTLSHNPVTGRRCSTDQTRSTGEARQEKVQVFLLMLAAKDQRCRRQLPEIADSRIGALLQDPALILYSQMEMHSA